MANDVVYTFGADAAGLEAAVAMAKANINSYAAELRNLAKEMKATGAAADSELGMKMRAAGEGITAAKANVSEFNAILRMPSGAKELATDLEKAGQAAVIHGAGIGFYAREVHVLIDELTSGRTRQLEGTIANIIGRFAAANLAMLPMIGTGLAIGGALAYLTYEAYSMNAAIQSVQMNSAIDQINLTTEASQALVKSIAKAASVSVSDAAVIANALMQTGPAGEVIAKIASNYIPAYIKAGGDAASASKELAGLFGDLAGKGRKYIEDTKGMTPALLQQYDAFMALGETGKAQAMVLDALNQRLPLAAVNAQKVTDHVRDLANAMVSASDYTLSYDQALLAAQDGSEKLYDSAQKTTEAILSQKTALDQAATSASKFMHAMDDAAKTDTLGTGLKDATLKMQEFSEARATALRSGDTSSLATLDRSLAKVTETAQQIKQQMADGVLGRDAVTVANEQIQTISETFKGSNVAMLNEQRKRIEQTLNQSGLATSQEHELQKELVAKNKEIRAADLAQFSAAKDLEATKANDNKAKILAIRQSEYAEAVKIDGAGSASAVSAMQRVEQARIALQQANKTAARDSLKLAQDGFNEEEKAAQNATKARIVLIADEAKRHQITEQQKVAETIAALKSGLDAETAILEKERQLNGLKPIELAKILDREKQLQVVYARDVMKIQEEAATQAAQTWEKRFTSINNSITGQISGLLKGTTNWATAFQNVLATLTTDLLTFFVNWGLKAAENTAMQIAGIGAVTTAQVAGDSAMVASATMADAAKNGSAMASIFKNIAASGAEAFAGVVGFLSPVMGPAAVGPAAATEATVLGAASGIAAFAQGSWSLPQSGLAMVHEREMIVPAAQTPWVQSMITNAKSGGYDPSQLGDKSSGDVHVHFAVNATDAQSVAALFKNSGRELAKIIKQHVEANPSLRPNY